MSEEGKSPGVIWVCDLCGKQCKGDEEKDHHTSETEPYHNKYTPIPEDRTLSIDGLRVPVLWEDFIGLEQRVTALEQQLKKLQKQDLEVSEDQLCIHCKTRPAHSTWRCCYDKECVGKELEEYQKLRKKNE